LKIKIHLIAAARPNFMKIAPLFHALHNEKWTDVKIVHTGQHYDKNMSDTFFDDLKLPDPHFHLGVGSGSHAVQTGNVMIAYEKLLYEHTPNLVVIVGDVNSTIACALATTKISYNSNTNLFNYPVNKELYEIIPNHRPVLAHLEAGLRSFDRTMPEEINRITTDIIADILWTPSPDADENLIREGVDNRRIIRVGNVMLDSYEMLKKKIEKQEILSKFSLEKSKYALVTLHRPANVDVYNNLKQLCEMLINVSASIVLVFPVHPRTRMKLEGYGLIDRLEENKNIIMLSPLNYVAFMHFVLNSRFVLTDSGGIQEETTYLGIPCLTLRSNTERPITISQGTNQLCRISEIELKINEILNRKPMSHRIPDLWDGKTAGRIVCNIKSLFGILM